VMAAHRAGGLGGAAALCLGVWAVAQTGALNLPSRPWATEIAWFFNPFGWQIVFFTGFAFGLGWLRAPPVDRRLARLAAAFVALCVPFAWHKIHGGFYLPDDWAVQNWIEAAREAARPLWRKTEQGALRWLHFLALAYLAWVAAGPGGVRLVEGFAPPAPPSRAWRRIAGAVALLTLPYAYIGVIADHAPALNAWSLAVLGDGARGLLGFDLLAPGEVVGLLMLAHLAALIALVWAALGPAGRDWAARRGWTAAVPVIRKVGQQSLAVFLVSMGLAQAAGIALDAVGRTALTTAAANLTGFAVLIATAYGVGWFRAQPWRRAPAGRRAPARAAGARPAAAE